MGGGLSRGVSAVDEPTRPRRRKSQGQLPERYSDGADSSRALFAVREYAAIRKQGLQQHQHQHQQPRQQQQTQQQSQEQQETKQPQQQQQEELKQQTKQLREGDYERVKGQRGGALEVNIPSRAAKLFSKLSPTSPKPGFATKRTRPGLPPLSKDQELVLELIDMQGLAQPLSDVHMRVSVVRKSGESFIVLSQGLTNKRFNTKRPTWYTFRQMLPFAEATDILQLEVISDRNLLGAARVVGTAQCSVADLGVNREIIALPLRKDPNVTIRVRRVFSVPGRKKLYLVRHGESRWNRAQARRNVVGMLAFRDHPLNKTGAQQAIDLNKRWRFEANVESNRREEDEDLLNQTIDPRAAVAAMSAIAAQATMGQVDLPARDSSKTRLDAQEQEQEEKEETENESLEAGFFRAKAIFSSPLTRSLQTALLGLQHHPCALETGITLLTCAREVQNLLGKDSMGSVCGEESFLRAKQLLRDECGDLHSNWEAGVQGVDPYDAESEWWIATKESRASVVARTEDFVNTIRYRPEREIIVVGHSLFFKHLFQSLSWDLDMQHPDYAAKRSLLDQLRRFKIENCGVVGVELSFEHYWPHMRRHASLARLLPDEAVLGRRPLRRALVATASGAMVAGKVIPSEINRPASSDGPDRARAAVATPPMAVPGVKRTTFSAPDVEPAEITMDDDRTSSMQEEEGESKTAEGEGEDIRYEEQMDAETELEESFGMDVEHDIVRSQILEAAAIVDVQLLFGSGLSNAPDESVDILAQTT